MSSAKANAKLAKVRSDRDALFAAGKFYEALQLYKTLVSRARVKRDWALAESVALEGAEALLAQNQPASGGELALALVELYTKSDAKPNQQNIRTLLELSTAFPTAAAAAAASSSSSSAAAAESSPSEAKIAFLKACIKWSSGSSSGSAGHPDLHLALARTYRSLSPAADFPAAHQQYLRSGGATDASLLTRIKPSAAASSAAAAAAAWVSGQEYEEDATLLAEWAAAGGLPSELDLFVTRAVLQFLCVEDIAGATTILAWFRQHRPAIADEPLLNFAGFVTETCQRSSAAAPLFDLLRAKYALALSRDQGLEAYLDMIAEKFFGRPAPKGFMESMLSGLGAGAGAAAAAPAQQPTSRPAAAAASVAAAAPPAAVEQQDAPMASDVD